MPLAFGEDVRCYAEKIVAGQHITAAGFQSRVPTVRSDKYRLLIITNY